MRRTAVTRLVLALGLEGCAQSAGRGDRGDARGDAIAEDARDADDGGAADDAQDAEPDVDVDAFIACDPDAATRPPGLGQSCAPGSGVDPRFCEEVHYCGGVFTMGEGGWELSNYGATEPIEPCGAHTAIARSGFIDAYEVTVGRFRQWVRAGMPHPADAEGAFGGRVSIGEYGLVLPTYDYWRGRRGVCAYTEEPGPNEDRPVNCVTMDAAAAFCWWDGKHLATEVGWEYVARNRGMTDTAPGVPASALTGAASCSYGDVGGIDGSCPAEALPQPAGSHSMGDTHDPPGVHDLYGGVSEITLGPGFPYRDLNRYQWGTCPAGAEPPPPSLDGDLGPRIDRGAGWIETYDTSDSYWAYASTRALTIEGPGPRAAQYGGSASEGIRCMRWEQEPR